MTDLLPMAIVVALVNGLFLLLSKVWAERRLAVVRQDHERDLEHLRAGLGALRDFALKHFDRRASLYWEALEPFVDLYVATSQGRPTEEELSTFQKRSLVAAARVHLFASEAVRHSFDEMLEWTNAGLRGEHSGGAQTAERHAQRFIQAAHNELLAIPQAPTLPGV